LDHGNNTDSPFTGSLTSSVDQCLDDGYAFFPGLVSEKYAEQIRKELHPWVERPALGRAGYIPIAGDRLLTDLGLYSNAALKLAVNNEVLDVLEGIFGTPVILTEFSFRRRTEPSEEMPWHSDIDGGVIIFIYLTHVSSELGSTCVIPKTHLIGSAHNDGYLQVPDRLIAEHRDEIVIPEGPPGSLLVFDQDIWHGRTPVAEPGRELLWLTYYPAEQAALRSNLRCSAAFLSGLTERQRKVLVPDAGNIETASEFFQFRMNQADAAISELSITKIAAILGRRLASKLKRPLRTIWRKFKPSPSGSYRKKISRDIPPKIRARQGLPHPNPPNRAERPDNLEK
jgi:hypothetical protein